MSRRNRQGRRRRAQRRRHQIGWWPQVEAAMAAAGRADGADAAGWWQQDTIGGRTTGDRAGTARRVLAGLRAVDPQVLDALPQPHLDATSAAGAYQEHAAATAPPWDNLDPGMRQLAQDAYRAAFDQAMEHEVAGCCRALLASCQASGQPDGPSR